MSQKSAPPYWTVEYLTTATLDGFHARRVKNWYGHFASEQDAAAWIERQKAPAGSFAIRYVRKDGKLGAPRSGMPENSP